MRQLLLLHNSGHLFTVEGNTQIGRGRGERPPGRWYTDRTAPPDFDDLELVIHIDGSPYMSRNHAGIRREGETYTLQDLNSCNGTHKNGLRIEPGKHYSLTAGDRVAMGPDEFLVGYAPEAFAIDETPDVRRAFKAVLRPAWYLGVAGLANDEHTRRTFQTSLARIAGELRRRGYRTEVHGLKAMPILPLHGPTIEVAALSTIVESLSRRGYAAGANAHTFFQYSGHGTMEGLVVNDSELLTPHMLFDAIGSIRGKKFLVLDACHAGVFLADRNCIPPQTSILAATRTADALALAEGLDESAERADLPMTMLSRRVWELLRDHGGPFNILSERARLEDAFQHDASGLVYVQEPGMNTVPYTVCIRSVGLCGIWAADFDQIIHELRARSKSG